MTKETINREYKDRLFKYIFGNEKHKDLTLSLYNAINGTSYTDANNLQIENLEDVVYLGMRNDLSFLIADSMNLYEQQSTYNPNMPVRMLCYVGKLYSMYFEKHYDLRNKLFGSRMVNIPCPKLICFYNGEREKNEEEILRLSDAFEDKNMKSDIEVTVRMLNINWGNNNKLMKDCKPLADYSNIVSNVRKLVRLGISVEDAIEMALQGLSGDSEVRKLIKENKAGVVDMFLTEYDEQGVMNVIKEEGRAEGREEGESAKGLEVAKKSIEEGLSLDVVNRITGIPIEELKKLK